MGYITYPIYFIFSWCKVVCSYHKLILRKLVKEQDLIDLGIVTYKTAL